MLNPTVIQAETPEDVVFGPRGLLWQMAVATLLSAAVLVSLVLFPTLIERGTFVLFLGAVSLATWLGGWRSGVATLLVAVLCMVWILPPLFEPSISATDDLVRLGTFVLISLLMAHLHVSRNRAVQNALLNRQRLLLALDKANMGAWDYDLVNGTFWWSPGLNRIFGRPPLEFSGTYDGFLAYMHPDDLDFVKRAVTNSTRTGTNFSIEHRIDLPDGSVRWITTRGHIYQLEHNQPRRMIAVVADITQRRKAQPAA